MCFQIFLLIDHHCKTSRRNLCYCRICQNPLMILYGDIGILETDLYQLILHSWREFIGPRINLDRILYLKCIMSLFTFGFFDILTFFYMALKFLGQISYIEKFKCWKTPPGTVAVASQVKNRNPWFFNAGRREKIVQKKTVSFFCLLFFYSTVRAIVLLGTFF